MLKLFVYYMGHTRWRGYSRFTHFIEAMDHDVAKNIALIELTKLRQGTVSFTVHFAHKIACLATM